MSNIHIQIEVSGLEQSSKILYSEALNRKRTDNILTKKMVRRTNNDLENTTQKTKDPKIR